MPTASENRETTPGAVRHHPHMDMDDDACYRAIETRDHRFDGRLFVAVTTTGIYCRPFCPAPTPRRKNVRFFPTAAAAQEAGFRPCLRCRPETSPDLAFWRGSSNTVSRALGLIEAGALDEATSRALATRLGMGERQLRRLFHQHLGASPISIAQTRRILLAKQLIQDTRPADDRGCRGRGLRQHPAIQRDFSAAFRRPPKALRRVGVADQSVATTGAVTVKLGYRPPYDWDSVLSFLRARAIPGIEAVSRDALCAHHRDRRRPRRTVVVEPADGNCLKATVRFPESQELAGDHRARSPRLRSRRRSGGNRRASQPGPGSGAACRRAPGPAGARRVGRIRTRGARHSWAADHGVGGDGARRQTGCALWREDRRPRRARAGADARVSHAAAIGRVPIWPRLACRRPGGTALSALAAAVAADPQIFGPRRSLEEAIAQLRSLAGIGEWTAQYIAMRELREPDAFPGRRYRPAARDALTGNGMRPSPAALLAHAEQWRPWRAYAALHLWASEAHATPAIEQVLHDQQAA